MSKRKLNEIQEPDSVAYTPTGQHYWKLVDMIQSAQNPKDIAPALQMEMDNCRTSLSKLKCPLNIKNRTAWPMYYQARKDDDNGNESFIAVVHKDVAPIHCIGCSLINGMSGGPAAFNWKSIWLNTFNINITECERITFVTKIGFQLFHQTEFARDSEIDQLRAVFFLHQQRNTRSSLWWIPMAENQVDRLNIVFNIFYQTPKSISVKHSIKWEEWHCALSDLCCESGFSYPKSTISLKMQFSGAHFSEEIFTSIYYLYNRARNSPPWIIHLIFCDGPQQQPYTCSDTQLSTLFFFIGMAEYITWYGNQLPNWFGRLTSLATFKVAPFWRFMTDGHVEDVIEINDAQVLRQLLHENCLSNLELHDFHYIPHTLVPEFVSCMQGSTLAGFCGAINEYTAFMFTPISSHPYFTHLTRLELEYDDNFSNIKLTDDTITALASSDLLLQLHALNVPCVTSEQSRELIPKLVQSHSLVDITFSKATYFKVKTPPRCFCLCAAKAVVEARPCLDLEIDHMSRECEIPTFSAPARSENPLRWKAVDMLVHYRQVFCECLGNIWWTFGPSVDMISPRQSKYLQPESRIVYSRHLCRDVEKKWMWGKIGLLISFLRANRQHPFQLSILTLIPSIFDMI